MKRPGALLACILLAACAGPQSSKAEQSAPATPSAASPSLSPSASATGAPSPSPLSAACPGFTVTTQGAVTASTPLFAVLETHRAGAKESEYSGSHDTVTVAGLDGFARVRVSFTPRSVPDMSADDGAFPMLQPEAVLAAGAVYAIDGAGRVCRIDRYGADEYVTTFPITSPHQAVSFAVSPDGAQLMAAVVTYPIYSPGPLPYQPVVSGSWELDMELAASGGTARVVRHQEKAWSSPPGVNNVVMAGWDSTDPVGVVGSYEGLGGPPPDGDRWPGDLSVHAVHLGLDGSIGGTLGPNVAAIPPNGCGLVSLGPNGAILCESGGGPGFNPQVYVGTTEGQMLWSSPISIYPAGSIVLSPEGSRMAMDAWLVSKNGSTVALLKGFRPRGWLDNQTLIGFVTSSATPSIGVVRLSSPSVAENWGFSGQFVGVF